jgi:BASS family bile acid:Na+ symporter
MAMTELLTPVLKIVLVIFMAGNLLDMGLRLNPRDALSGLRDVRFVAYTLVWSFVLSPALAYAITRIVPLDEHYATGLLLMGLAPCAPFLPSIVDKAKGDLGYTAALMLLTAVGTVALMPIGVPLLVPGLSVSAWAIAKPLLVVILLPLAAGVLIRAKSPHFATRLLPVVKKITGIATLATAALLLVVYGKELLGVPGSFAVVAQLVFYFVLAIVPYMLAVGLRYEQGIVLSAGMTTRNLGAAMAPLFASGAADERAMIMVVLGLPLMVVVARLAAKWFGRRATPPAAAALPQVSD